MAPPASPSPDVRRARWAVAALFFTNGALLAGILPRYPEIKASLDLGAGAYGLALAAFPAGAILAGLGAGSVIRRLGSARTAVVGTVLTGLALLLAGSAPVAWMFAGGLLLAGAMDAVTDVAQNAHGLRVQRRHGRSIINGFHAIWSIGAVTGGGMAAGAIALRVPLPLHLGLSAVLFTIVALIALRACLPGPEDAEPRESAGSDRAASGTTMRTVVILAALVLVAGSGTIVEDVGNSWAALYLGSALGAAPAVAAWGYIVLVGAQFIGRILGDAMTDRMGARSVAILGAVLAGVGMTLALAAPSLPGTLAGFAAAGFGVATLVPAAMQRADELPGLRPGTGLTLVSWLMRAGFLLSPVIIGQVSELASLRGALLIVPAAALVVLLCSPALSPRRAR